MPLLYSCLAVPADEAESQSPPPDKKKKVTKTTLINAQQLRLMFLCKHAKSSPGTAKLLCKAFSKSSVVPQTIYTKEFQCEDDLLAFVGKETAKTSELKSNPTTLMVKNVVTNTYCPTRSLVITQTNIYLALNRSLSKCSSDPVKWYIFTAARLLVGDPEEMPYSYTNLTAFLTHYYQASKYHQDHTVYSNPSDDVLKVYSRVFGGKTKLAAHVAFARETISAALQATRRLEDIYDAYNFDRETITCNSVSYANLEYFCDMNARFGSIIDILMSDTKKDQEHVKAYRARLETVVDSGAKYIQSYLNDTVKYEPYEHKKHTSYEFDSVRRDTHGLGKTMTCGQMTKALFTDGPTTFPTSLSKTFRGTSAHDICHLCNSDRKMIMSGELVKDILKRTTNVPVNSAFVGVQMNWGGFQFTQLHNRKELDEGFFTSPMFRALSVHTKKDVGQKMTTYNAYSRELRTGTPKLALNELIVPYMTAFTLSLDLDAKDLVKQFYGANVKDGWGERKTVVATLEAVMTEMLLMVGRKNEEFVCCTYESQPDSPAVSKVGLRVIFKFKRLIFKNTKVLARFVAAYKFFLTRRSPALGYSIDDAMYTGTGKMLRLPAMYKIRNKQPIRQFVALMFRPTKAFAPSYGLVHAKHTFLAESGVEVMTDVGCIQSLIKTPQNAEYDRLTKRCEQPPSFTERKRRVGGGYTDFFTSILKSTLMPAIHAAGGGGYPEDTLTGVTRQVGSFEGTESYTLTPAIRWCVNRAHINPSTNPCRYYIVVNTNGTYSLGMMCFGCGFYGKIFIGDISELN